MNKTPRLLDTTHALEGAARELRGASSFFIDTEFESGRGGTTLCLIQISAGTEIYLIDARRLSAMDTLAGAITSPGAEWVLHAGRIDIDLLLGKFNLVEPPSIFDTQVAWGLLGAEYSVSLAYLNYKLLDRKTEKEHQADPWDERPIPPSQLAYAASDIETLPLLRERLGERLETEGKRQLVHDVSKEFCFTRPHETPRREAIAMDDFRKAWELDSGGQAALRFLIDWYNDGLDDEKPVGLKPRVLFLIARRMPESGGELAKIKGVPKRWAYQHGDRLTGRLIRAASAAVEEQFIIMEPQPYVTFEELRIDAFLTAVRHASSHAVSMAPDICFPSWLLQDRLKPRLLSTGDVRSGVDALEGWRQDWLAKPFADFSERWLELEAG